jgi:IS30 family transposase
MPDLTLQEIAKRLGVTRQAVHARRKRGQTDAEILAGKRAPKGQRIRYRGRTQTIGEWAHELGRPESSIRARLRRGLSPTEALLGGRAARATEVRATINVNAKSLAQRQRWQKAAANSGLHFAEWVRRSLDASARWGRFD